MIEFRNSGNLLDEQVDALVNTVNCKGIMGKGIALEFKKRFPDNFKLYADACDKGDVRTGRVFITAVERNGDFDEGSDATQLNMFVDGSPSCESPRFIVNFPTKNHWRQPSKIEYIETGLESLTAEIESRDIHSIAVPPLGCGLGGLRWTDVKQKIESAFDRLPSVEVIVFEPR